MLIRRLLPRALALALGFAVAVPTCLAAGGQSLMENAARERAKAPYDAGLAQLRNEAFEAALKSFQQAVELDPSFDMAHYMLGRTHMLLRNYVAASVALNRSRELFQADSTRQFTDKQQRQQIMRDRIRDLDQLIEDTRRAADLPANVTRRFSMLQDVRLYEERKRQLQDADRNDASQSTMTVPAFVSLALGSAYFRSGKLNEAEQAYLAALAADPKIGEAHNNLAVVYFETGRYDQASRAVGAAEKAGVRVHPDLKADIAKKLKAKG